MDVGAVVGVAVAGGVAVAEAETSGVGIRDAIPAVGVSLGVRAEVGSSVIVITDGVERVSQNAWLDLATGWRWCGLYLGACILNERCGGSQQ